MQFQNIATDKRFCQKTRSKKLSRAYKDGYGNAPSGLRIQRHTAGYRFFQFSGRASYSFRIFAFGVCRRRYARYASIYTRTVEPFWRDSPRNRARSRLWRYQTYSQFRRYRAIFGLSVRYGSSRYRALGSVGV